jgi:hypothetical protein
MPADKEITMTESVRRGLHPDDGARAPWACHFLIAEDNNLAILIKDQVKQLATADPNKVTVVAQLDTPTTRAERYVLNPDRKFELLGARSATDHNLDIGDPQVIINFLIAARHLRSANYLAVIASSHGTGFADLAKFGRKRSRAMHGEPLKRPAWALGLDDTSRSFLDNNELTHALEYSYERFGHRRPDILGCDACLMASVEAAHQLRNSAKYLVASQDNESADGWPYEEILATFGADVEPPQAVVNIVREYAKATTGDNDATLSAVALDLMDQLASALDHLGVALLPLVKSNLRILARAREDSRVLANFDSIDLFGYAMAVGTRVGEAMPDDSARRAIRAAADSVITTLKHAVVETSKDPQESGAHGLSVYMPNSPVFDAYDDIPLSEAAPHWHDFVVSYGAQRHLI